MADEYQIAPTPLRSRHIGSELNQSKYLPYGKTIAVYTGPKYTFAPANATQASIYSLLDSTKWVLDPRVVLGSTSLAFSKDMIGPGTIIKQQIMGLINTHDAGILLIISSLLSDGSGVDSASLQQTLGDADSARQFILTGTTIFHENRTTSWTEYDIYTGNGTSFGWKRFVGEGFGSLTVSYPKIYYTNTVLRWYYSPGFPSGEPVSSNNSLSINAVKISFDN